MTIDTKELRRLAQAATPGPDGVSLSWITLLQDFQQGANPAVINELLDRLEYVEKDITLKEVVIDSLGSTLNAVSNERDVLRDRLALESQENGALRDSVDRACEERDELRARVEAMEKKEPAATVRINAINGNPSVDFVPGHRYLHHNDKLYLAPGAQPVPSVPTVFVWPECPKRRQSHVLFDDGYEEGWAACVATIKAMIAAAPEAKP